MKTCELAASKRKREGRFDVDTLTISSFRITKNKMSENSTRSCGTSPSNTRSNRSDSIIGKSTCEFTNYDVTTSSIAFASVLREEILAFLLQQTTRMLLLSLDPALQKLDSRTRKTSGRKEVSLKLRFPLKSAKAFNRMRMRPEREAMSVKLSWHTVFGKYLQLVCTGFTTG